MRTGQRTHTANMAFYMPTFPLNERRLVN